ncbi:MAG TPA: hypothetical protein VHX36_09695 [Candidatus Acidoferrales bacterium]|jgi:hypothetical protein|nr:hypothetical protein [Candidatus Acidoferrales bacterium]
MSRDFTPGEFDDLRDAQSVPRERTPDRGTRQPQQPRIPDRNSQDDRDPESIRNLHRPDPRFYDSPSLCRGRDRDYRLRRYEEHALADIGRFRVVATEDLAKYLYEGHSVELERDLRSLERQGLIQHKTFEGSDGSARELLALTKAGYRLLRARHALPETQTAYYGFVKPKEASHDADIYRVYQKEGRRIARNGGRKFRVILDFELKKRLNRDFATFGAESRQEIAARHGLRVVNGKVPVPDLRIEYETPEGDMGRVDLELATEHYRPRQLAEKVRAGFSLYAPRSEADRLRRVLDQRELTAEILSL